MKIYLRVHKDQGYHVAHLWSKHIKEQIIETVTLRATTMTAALANLPSSPHFGSKKFIHAAYM